MFLLFLFFFCLGLLWLLLMFGNKGVIGFLESMVLGDIVEFGCFVELVFWVCFEGVLLLCE